MPEDKIKFLEKPFFIDNSEIVVVAELFVDGSLILEKLKEFANEKRIEAMEGGYDSEDCNNCERAIFDLRNIEGKQYLLIRAGCLIRGKFKMDEIIYLVEREVQ